MDTDFHIITHEEEIRGMNTEELVKWIKHLIIRASHGRCDDKGVWTKAPIVGGELIPWEEWLKICYTEYNF